MTRSQCQREKAPSSFLFLVAMPGAPSSVLAPSSKARSPLVVASGKMNITHIFARIDCFQAVLTQLDMLTGHRHGVQARM